MKRVMIRECGEFEIPCQYILDLRSTAVKDCTGCWSCWIKTPGRCVHKDLDEFYTAYLDADKVIIFLPWNWQHQKSYQKARAGCYSFRTSWVLEIICFGI